MKTLHLYLTRQILATVLMTVAVFTFVLLLGNVLKEIVTLLINRQATLLIVAQAIGLLIPYVLVFALPMGMLTATLLVFGRFSADHELAAARASGISLVSLSAPILLLAGAFSVLCAYVNLQLAPQCRVAYKELLFDVLKYNPTGALREKQYNNFPGGWTIYVHKIKGKNLEGVKVYRVDEESSSLVWFNAHSGKFNVENNLPVLTLFEATVTEIHGASVIPSGYSEEMTLPLTGNANTNKTQKISLTDMTFFQLREQLHQLEHSFQTPGTGKTSPDPLGTELRTLDKMRKDVTLPVRVQIHRQVAFSFACIGFTLIGIPLGIRAHRRETSMGIAISLALVLVYYSFIILAQSWDTRPNFMPHLVVWIPNFIFQAVGGFLLWRANKGI
ncbi:MAG: LptF/LptG family permease [Verrucomicrobiota bacterium]